MKTAVAPKIARYFLSYGGENRPAASALAHGLQTVGVDLFFDDQINYGAGWQSRLEEELQRCDGILVVVGAGTINGWSRAEVEVANQRQIKDSSFRIIPFLLPNALVDRLPPFLSRFHAYRFEHEPASATQEDFNTVSLLLGLRPPPDTAHCPFPGLESFDEQLAPYFFGRSGEIEGLVQKVQVSRNGHCPWLQLEGNSGSGKSSLAKAGLVPAMRDLGWKVGVTRPGTRPLRNLAQAVYSVLQDNLSERWNLDRVTKEFMESPSALVSLIREAGNSKSGFLLLIDQLEEVFILGQVDPAASAQLSKLLKEALDDADLKFCLVTTIRSDFMHHFHELPDLEEMLASRTIRHYTITLSQSALRAAMEGPSKATDLDWESGLIERVLNDISSKEAMPLLAHVLYALWLTRQHNLLTHRSYDALGKATGALVLSANAVVDRLPEDARTLAKMAMLCLVRIEQKNLYARRNASRDEVLSAMGNGARAESVLAYLSGGRTADFSSSSPSFMRLLTVTSEGPQESVDLVHEALIREWPTLKEWVDEHALLLQKRDALESAAGAWIGAGRPPEGLPGGAQLEYLKSAPAHTEPVREFLDAAERRAKRVRRIKLCALAAGVVFLILSFVAASDLGLKLPGMHSVRSILDDHELSYFRPLAPKAEIQAQARNVRGELLSILESRWRPDGTISSDYQAIGKKDTWATRQAIAGILACRECSVDPSVSAWIQSALQAAFQPSSMHVDEQGRNYGWMRNDDLRVTMSEPVVWMQVAIARAYRDPALSHTQNDEPMKSWLATTDKILDQYTSSDGITLNSFPRQLDRSEVGMYPTVVLLIALLERRASGISGNDPALDDRIRKLAKWLCDQFDATHQGWRAFPNAKDGNVLDGFNYQIYSALLWTEHDLGFQIPEKILHAIPLALMHISDKSYGDPLEEIRYSNKYLDESGNVATAGEDIVLLWHPWALQTAWRWLDRAEHSRHFNSRDSAIARRALTHLTEMSGDVIKSSRQTFTYTPSETLYAMSIL